MFLISKFDCFVDSRAANWTRVLALLDPVSNALFVEDMLLIARQFGHDVILTILHEADGALLISLVLPDGKRTVLDAGEGAKDVL